YQLPAAIVACHAEAPSWPDTDWTQILLLYDALLEHLPSAVVRLHRTIAIGQVMGPEKALSEADALAPHLDRYHLLHATRAEFLRALGRHDKARGANEPAPALPGNPPDPPLPQHAPAWQPLPNGPLRPR